MKSSYVKTLLYAYPNIPKIIQRIDTLVEKKARASMSDISSCQEQCEKIVNLTVQKGILFEIRHYLEIIFNRLEEEEKAYVEHKYFKFKTKKQFKNVDFKSRNYFRKQLKLLEYISKCFEWLNLSNEWFEKKCKRVPYIKKLLQSVELRQNTINCGCRFNKVHKEDEQVA